MTGAPLQVAGAALWATAEGALWWPEEATLVVADLHLEKGSSLARRGALLPPYDTAATLATLGRLVETLAPRRVVCLGDSFHDGARLRALADGRDWLWIAGNHDGAGLRGLGGRVAAEAVLGPLILRHQASKIGADGEISGHYHPKASVVVGGRRIGGRCFASDGRRLILPAFGTFTGGLDVFNPAIAALLAPGFTVWLLARGRVHRLPGRRLHRSAVFAAAER
jgi:uncharacterized protein